MANTVHPLTLAEPSRDSGHTEKALPPFWRGLFLWGFLLLVAFAGGWYLAGRNSSHHEKDELPADSGLGEPDSSAIMVTVEPVTYRVAQRTVEGMGTLYGYEEVTLSARVEGRVRKLLHDVSDRVKPGEILLQIDPTDYELAEQQAERVLQVELSKLGQKTSTSVFDVNKVPTVMLAQTRMENARARMDRVRKLMLTRAISNEEADNASSDHRVAQSELASQILLAQAGLATVRLKQTALLIAKQQLKDTEVRVPTPTQAVPGTTEITYVVAQRNVAEGTLVRAGTDVFKLVINQALKLRVPVPERFTGVIRLAQKADVNTAALSRSVVGTVTRINPAVDVATRTFEVEVLVPNPSSELKPGSFAKAAILTSEDSKAVTVPMTAIGNFAGITKIFLYENGRVKEVKVTLGMQTTQWVEIASPALPPGAMVVTSGQTVLADDTPVVVRNVDAKKSSPVR